MNQGISISGNNNVTGNNNVVAMEGSNININASEALLYELLEQMKRLNTYMEMHMSLLEDTKANLNK